MFQNSARFKNKHYDTTSSTVLYSFGGGTSRLLRKPALQPRLRVLRWNPRANESDHTTGILFSDSGAMLSSDSRSLRLTLSHLHYLYRFYYSLTSGDIPCLDDPLIWFLLARQPLPPPLQQSQSRLTLVSTCRAGKRL